jgi:signal transduction histidine kinase
VMAASFERTRPDGTVIEVRHNPMPDGGVVLIYSDITERKRSEAEIRVARDAAQAAYRDLKAAQANLIQAEKMASLGQLTAGIAHEIKNPLNFVNNFASLSVELLARRSDQRPLRPLHHRLRPIAAGGAGVQRPCRFPAGAGELGVLSGKRPSPKRGFSSRTPAARFANGLTLIPALLGLCRLRGPWNFRQDVRMPGVVSRNAVLISQDVNRDKTAFHERCLLRGAAEQAEQKFSCVRHRGRVNVE